MQFHRAVWLLLLAQLGACGGGDPDRPEDLSAEGLYRLPGEMFSETLGRGWPAMALVGPDGEAQIIVVDRAQFAGRMAVTGDSLQARLTGYAVDGTRFEDGAVIARFDLQARLYPGEGIQGRYQGAGEQGRLHLYSSAEHEPAIALELLQGVWSSTQASSATTLFVRSLAIDTQGHIDGSDTSGCVYAGRISPTGESRSLWRIGLTLSLCAHAGEYAGLGAVYDLAGSSQGRNLLMAVSKDTAAFAAELVQH